jgi:hypothetical protein
MKGSPASTLMIERMQRMKRMKGQQHFEGMT